MPAPQTPRRERPEDRVSPRCEGSAGRRKAACAHTLSPKPFELEHCGVGPPHSAPRPAIFGAPPFTLSLGASTSKPRVHLRTKGTDFRRPTSDRLARFVLSPSGLADECGERPRLRFHAARYAELPRTPIAPRDTDGPARPLDEVQQVRDRCQFLQFKRVRQNYTAGACKTNIHPHKEE